VGLFLIMEAVVCWFIAYTCAFEPGFLVTLVFLESVIRVPYRADETVGIICAVLNNLPVPV